MLHCVLIDSPEALNVIKEQHIRTVISLIDKHGRDPKVYAARPPAETRLEFWGTQRRTRLSIHV